MNRLILKVYAINDMTNHIIFINHEMVEILNIKYLLNKY